ncbi:hypothetical protein CSUI_009894 [Cystoisospora suis]|uniref:Uncharacterized protein n=1 Tax=Cystoisospora suis TaxID=483139 RepID=A0A2C6KIG0_9APIC|nr:hypothetical protein CSUI_009894 [Cystoisospora suis]
MRSVREYCNSAGTSISSEDTQSLESSLLSLLGGPSEEKTEEDEDNKKTSHLLKATKERLLRFLTKRDGTSVVDVVLTFLTEIEEEKRRQKTSSVEGERRDRNTEEDQGEDDASFLAFLKGLQKEKKICSDKEERDTLSFVRQRSSDLLLPFRSSFKDISLRSEAPAHVVIPLDEISQLRSSGEEEEETLQNNEEEETRFLESLDKTSFHDKKVSSSKNGIPEEERERPSGERTTVVSRKEEKHNNSAVSEVDAKEETFVSTEEKLEEREKRDANTLPLVEKHGKHTSSETLEDISCNREEAGDVEEEICIERTKEEPRRRRSRIKELGRQRSRSLTDRNREEAFIEALGQRAKADFARRRRRRASQSRSPSHFSTSSLSSSASPLVEDRSASVFRSTTPLSSSSINPSSRCDHAETKREDLSQRGRTSDSPLSSSVQEGRHLSEDDVGGEGGGEERDCLLDTFSSLSSLSFSASSQRTDDKPYVGEVIDEVRAKQKEERRGCEGKDYFSSEILRKQASREISGRVIAYCRSLGGADDAVGVRAPSMIHGEQEENECDAEPGTSEEIISTEKLEGSLKNEEKTSLVRPTRSPHDREEEENGHPEKSVSCTSFSEYAPLASLHEADDVNEATIPSKRLDKEDDPSESRESLRLSSDESSLFLPAAGSALADKREGEARRTERERAECREGGDQQAVMTIGKSHTEEGEKENEEQKETMSWVKDQEWEETINQVHLVTSLQEDLENQMDLELRRKTRRHDVTDFKKITEEPSFSSPSGDPVEYLPHSGENTRSPREAGEEGTVSLIAKRHEEVEYKKGDEVQKGTSVGTQNAGVEGDKRSMTSQGHHPTKDTSGQHPLVSSSASVYGCLASPASFYIGDETPSVQSETELAGGVRGRRERGGKRGSRGDRLTEGLRKERSIHGEFRRSVQKDDEDWVNGDSMLEGGRCSKER